MQNYSSQGAKGSRQTPMQLRKPYENQLAASTSVGTDNSKINRADFPDDFVFGVGTSAFQHEGAAAKGGKGPSIWDDFTLRYPSRITDGNNGNVAVDMYNKYKEDIMEMKKMGFTVYRFSISWPRILPGGKPCLGVNKEGIAYYNDIINTLLDNGMEPYVTLFHWDLPQCLELEYGGFLCKDKTLENNRIVNDFREYAELCFWEFGDRVKHWFTLNEPWTYTVHGYVNCIFPPSKDYPDPFPMDVTETKILKKNAISHRGVNINPEYTFKGNSDKDAYDVARNLLLAHATAVQSYRSKFQDYQNGKIGMTLVSHYFTPLDDDDDDDIEASKRGLDFMLGWFLEPVLSGQYPQRMIDNVPSENLKLFSEEESKLLKGSIDFLGLNYYTTYYAADEPYPNEFEVGYWKDQEVAYSTSNSDGVPIGPVPGSAWLYIYPLGFYLLLKHIYDTYKGRITPIYITENGVDEKNDCTLTTYEACADPVRIQYYQDHLAYLRNAMTDFDLDVRGYIAWSWCDNFEWAEGYSVRSGIIFVDYMNNLARYPKHSAVWFSKFLHNDLLNKKNDCT